LFAHFKQVIEILNTDAAADERKAMRLLRSRSQGSAASSAAMLPNIKATVRLVLNEGIL
jgi:hypothetical protein